MLTPGACAAMTVAFLYAMVEIFKGYFEDDFDEDSLRDNFTLVYELLDGGSAAEISHTNIDADTVCCRDSGLRISAKHSAGHLEDVHQPGHCAIQCGIGKFAYRQRLRGFDDHLSPQANEDTKMTSQITGARDWRREVWCMFMGIGT